MAYATTFTDPNAPQVAIPAALTNSSASSLSFPGSIENAAYYTRLSFYKYSRSRPSDKAKDELRATVILPIPETFGDRIAADWNQTELGVFGGLVDATGSATQQLQSGSSAYDVLKGTLNGVKLNSARDAGVLAMTLTPKSMRDSSAGAVQAFASQALGAVVNPHLTATFNGVPLRQHVLQWKFSPRNAKEATDLGKIINRIRSEALPSYNQTVSKFALDYPSTVQAEFVNVSKDYKTKIFKSTVIDFTTDLGVSGVAFYANGVPVEVSVNMTLQETEICTREDFPVT